MVSALTACLLLAVDAQAAAPVVSNVRASQRAGSKFVDIYYDLSDADSSALTVSISVSADAGSTWTVPAYNFTGAYGAGVSPGVNKYVVWSAGVDWDGQFTSQCRVRVVANDADPDGVVQIPAGSFTMGDTFAEGSSSEQPTHTVNISAFYIEKTEVTKERWVPVYQYAIQHGYQFDNAGAQKAAGHPLHTINWFDAVKWCNARSQMEGRTPCYYTDTSLTNIYKTGQLAPNVNWSANGNRLPTEAEWEKAARGGLTGRRFPWGDNITTNQANYYGTALFYNLSGAFGNHPAYATGSTPYTSPVADFSPNGYSLFDVAGNVWEWCWDWYDGAYYSSSPGTDPGGPSSGTSRVLRGGPWDYDASRARCADRLNASPATANSHAGFRCVRGN